MKKKLYFMVSSLQNLTVKEDNDSYSDRKLEAWFWKGSLDIYRFLIQNRYSFILKLIFKVKKHELGGVLVTKTDPYVWNVQYFFVYLMSN